MPLRSLLGLGAALGGGIVLWAAAVALALGYPPQPDIAWPLYLAGEVLQGARLGLDYIEVNPPLYVWLAIPPVLLSQALGSTPWLANVVLGTALVAISLRLTVVTLRLAGVSGGGWVAAGLASLFAMTALPGWDSFQREHLTLICTIPYAVMTAARVQGATPGARTALGVGLFAAVGIALKPHFLLAWILLEGYVLARRGRTALTRVEAMAVPVAGLCYLVAVLLVTPDYLPSVLGLAGIYDDYLQKAWYSTIAPTPLMLIPAFALAGFVFRRQHAGSSQALQDVFMLGTLGFWLAAIAQGKGLGYHYLPATGFGFLLLLGLAIEGSRPAAPPLLRVIRLGAQAGMIIVGVLLATRLVGAVVMRTPPPFLGDGFRELRAALGRDAENETVVVLSSNLGAGWPLTTELRARWGLRYVSLWPMAGFYADQLRNQSGMVRHRALGERQGFELQFSQEVVSDLVKGSPRYLLVMDPDPGVLAWGGATRFDYLDYFQDDPAFQALLAQYDDLGTVSRYSVWRRRDRVAELVR